MDHTANLWHGCTKVHEGCDNCYAETIAKRWGNDIWGNDKPRKEIKSVWKDLDKMQNAAKKLGVVHSVFVGSMMDIFEKPMPLVNSNGERFSSLTEKGVVEATTGVFRDIFFKWITEGRYPNLLFLLLTKRPGNINRFIPESWKENAPQNVMFGTSPVNQQTAKKLIPLLQEVNGRRFLSIEPQLGHIDIEINSAETGKYLFEGIEWIIQGGESGHHKRPFDLRWACDMKRQCFDLGIPYFFKQIDKIQSIPEYLQIQMFPEVPF